MKRFKLSTLLLPAVLLIAATSCKKTEMIDADRQVDLSTNVRESSPEAAITYNY